MRGPQAANLAQYKADMTGMPYTFCAVPSGMPGLGDRYEVEPAPQFLSVVGDSRHRRRMHSIDGMQVEGTVVPPERELDLCNQDTWDTLDDAQQLLGDWLEGAVEIVDERTNLGCQDGVAYRGAEECVLNEIGSMMDKMRSLQGIIARSRSEEIVLSEGPERKVLGFPVR